MNVLSTVECLYPEFYYLQQRTAIALRLMNTTQQQLQIVTAWHLYCRRFVLFFLELRKNGTNLG